MVWFEGSSHGGAVGLRLGRVMRDVEEPLEGLMQGRVALTLNRVKQTRHPSPFLCPQTWAIAYIFQADGGACALPPRATALSGRGRGVLRRSTSVPASGRDAEANSPLLWRCRPRSGQITGILPFLWCLFSAPA